MTHWGKGKSCQWLEAASPHQDRCCIPRLGTWPTSCCRSNLLPQAFLPSPCLIGCSRLDPYPHLPVVVPGLYLGIQCGCPWDPTSHSGTPVLSLRQQGTIAPWPQWASEDGRWAGAKQRLTLSIGSEGVRRRARGAPRTRETPRRGSVETGIRGVLITTFLSSKSDISVSWANKHPLLHRPISITCNQHQPDSATLPLPHRAHKKLASLSLHTGPSSYCSLGKVSAASSQTLTTWPAERYSGWGHAPDS